MFSVEALEKGIKSSYKNIEIFKQAIRDEESKQDEWRSMIITLKKREHDAELAKIEIDAKG